MSGELAKIEMGSSQTNQRRLSSCMVAFNVHILICSINTLGFPYAFAIGGWTALASTLFIGALSCYTCELIGQCLYDHLPTRKERRGVSGKMAWEKLKMRHQTIVSIGHQAFPKYGRQLVILIMLIELAGSGVLLLVLLGSSTSALAIYFGCPYATTTKSTAFFGYLSLPLAVIPSMRIISWFSFVAVSGLLMSLTTVAIGCIMQLVYNPIQWEFLITPDLHMVPIAIAMIVFTYSVHVIIPSVEGAMRSPHHYSPMIRITFAVATTVKVVFGLLCSLTFGSKTLGSISDNVSDQPWIFIITHFSVSISVFFSLPLIFDAIGSYSDMLLEGSNREAMHLSRSCGSLYHLWLIGTRGAVLGICILIGILVPHFALVMAIVGSVASSFVCFIFPSIFHYLLFRNELNIFQKAVRIAITIFGLIASVACVYFTSARLYLTCTS